MASLPRRWRITAGVAAVRLLAVIGSYLEANPAHAYAYGGLHLTSHPPLAAYLLVGVPALALVWRGSRPAGVFLLAVAGDVGWAALGQIDGAALVPVIVALYWIALTRSRRVALTAGIAGAVVIFLAEGWLGPFGWLGGPNATMWPELLAAGALGGYVAARRQWLAAERDRKEHGHLLVDVVNDSGTAGAPFSDGTGAGLTGTKERAAALGGTLEAGALPRGGFRVLAKLPITAAAAGQEPEAAPAASGARAPQNVSRP